MCKSKTSHNIFDWILPYHVDGFDTFQIFNYGKYSTASQTEQKSSIFSKRVLVTYKLNVHWELNDLIFPEIPTIVFSCIFGWRLHFAMKRSKISQIAKLLLCYFMLEIASNNFTRSHQILQGTLHLRGTMPTLNFIWTRFFFSSNNRKMNQLRLWLELYGNCYFWVDSIFNMFYGRLSYFLFDFVVAVAVSLWRAIVDTNNVEHHRKKYAKIYHRRRRRR